MANLTTTTSAVFIPEIWSQMVLMAAERYLVMAPLIARYDADVKQKGDVVHIPNIANLSTSDKTQDSEVTPTSPTETENTITVDQWKYVALRMEDIVKIQSQYALMSLYTEKAGEAIARQVDTDLMGLYSSLTSTDVGTYGQNITDAVINLAMNRLDTVDAPLENRYFVVHPDQKMAIQLIDKFMQATYLGQYDQPQPTRTGPATRGLWGELYGVPVYYTNNVSTTAGTPTQQHNLFFHKEAFALAMQMSPRTQTSYQHEYLADLLTVDTIYGVATLRDTFGVEMRS